MKKSIIIATITTMCFSVLVGRSEIPKPDERRNIKGRVTLQVVDDNARSVEGVNVDMYFIYSDTFGGWETVSGKTDTNGFFSAEGISKGRLSHILSKDDYYQTKGEYKFYKAKDASVENRRWLPWNPVVKAVLKPKKTPIPMHAKRVEIDIPEQNQPIGFDMEKGDWVTPYGEGSVSDFDVTYSTQQEAVHRFTKKMTFSVPAPRGGFVVKKQDEFSSFVSDYNAPTNGYEKEYLFEQKRTPQKIQIHKSNNDNEYFIVRSRVVTNDVGEIVSANYSKIYGPIQYALWRNQKYLEFIYYFNPTPNDINLEFDPEQNLLKKLTSLEEVHAP